MSRSRMNGGVAASTYRQQLLEAMRIFLVPSVFDGGRGLRRWTLRTLTYTAVLMAWGEGRELRGRFEAALSWVDTMFVGRRRVGRTYQGFIKALRRRSPRLLRGIERQLCSAVRRTASSGWRMGRWVVMGVDGSKFAAPLTAANERAFGCSGRGCRTPQVWLTTILHLGSGLPWCWKIGKANADERAHLRAMMHRLPASTLLVADAGFTGYPLWRSLIVEGHSILIRVGGNVRLLTKLGYMVREHDGLVYLWPDQQRRRGREPLVLRLIRVHDGRRTMCLVTDVLDASLLSDAQAASIYRQRWGLELNFRAIKQTMARRKLRSDAPVQAALELRWSVVGLTLLGLMGVGAIVGAGRPASAFSVAGTLRVLRAALRRLDRRTPRRDHLHRRLAAATKDPYTRRADKAARDWPRKRTCRPTTTPQIRPANQTEIQDAIALRSHQTAA